MYIEGEPVVAYCYIGAEGDQKNMCFLTKESLIVRYKNKLTTFDQSGVKGIAFEHKIFLFPLVLGGIVAPLSIHGLLTLFTNPWLLLSLMVLGLFLVYYGWEGSSTLTIKTNIKDHYFFIKAPTTNLLTFAKYAELYISGIDMGRKFYFATTPEEWQKIKENEVLIVAEPLKVYDYSEIIAQNHGPDEVILTVDPLEDGIEVSFIKMLNKDQLQAVIKHDIPIGYISELTR